MISAHDNTIYQTKPKIRPNCTFSYPKYPLNSFFHTIHQCSKQCFFSSLFIPGWFNSSIYIHRQQNVAPPNRHPSESREFSDSKAEDWIWMCASGQNALPIIGWLLSNYNRIKLMVYVCSLRFCHSAVTILRDQLPPHDATITISLCAYWFGWFDNPNAAQSAPMLACVWRKLCCWQCLLLAFSLYFEIYSKWMILFGKKKRKRSSHSFGCTVCQSIISDDHHIVVADKTPTPLLCADENKVFARIRF